jgi:hypothetical protein
MMVGELFVNRLLATLLPVPLALIIANTQIISIEGTSSLLVALFFSLIVQEILCHFVFFKEQNVDLSRRLGGVEKLTTLSSKITPFFTSLFVLIFPFIVSGVFLLIVASVAADFLDLSNTGWIFLWISLGLLIDPLTATFVESTISNAITASAGYLSIILIGIGAVSTVSISLFNAEILSQLLICLALLNVRITYMVEFGYKKNMDITSFAPSIAALFVAMLPNLQAIVGQL